MLKDNYTLSSNFRPKKSAVECNVKEFFELFEDYFIKMKSRTYPDLKHIMCDPYGFALLCQDYEGVSQGYTEENISCENSFRYGIDTCYDSIFKFKFPFKILLDILHKGYYFDYDLAVNIYKMQKNPFRIFYEIMNGHGYIMNRFNPTKRKVGKLMNFAYDSKITLNEDEPIEIPYKNRVCDGKTWPCIVSPSFLTAKIIKDDTDGYGEGLFVVDDKLRIIDVLKINDLWLVDTPLENRLSFGVHSRNYKVIPYMKCFSWRSCLDAGKIMKCNKTRGVLVRPCHENYFNTSWFEWSRTSLLYCCLINGKLQITNRKKSKPNFYTLEGDLGEVNPYEERVYERIWLDDFDINEFCQILSLGE